MLVAMVLIPGMDALAKILSEDGMAPSSVALGRFIAQLILLVGTVVLWRRLRSDSPALRPSSMWVHLVRGALHGGSTLAFFVAVKYMPLADSIAVFFVEPMLLLALTAIFLREHVGWPRRIAAVIGFGGSLLVVQPSYELFGAVSLLPLLAALLFAGYLIFTRRFGGADHPLTMQIWSATGAGILISLAILVGETVEFEDYSFTAPDSGQQFTLLAMIGVISAIAHVLIVIAFSLAPAAVLAPFNYLEIVSATVLGYVVFNDFPGGLQWLGIGIVVSTGLFIFFRERHLERQDGQIQSLIDS